MSINNPAYQYTLGEDNPFPGKGISIAVSKKRTDTLIQERESIINALAEMEISIAAGEVHVELILPKQLKTEIDKTTQLALATLSDLNLAIQLRISNIREITDYCANMEAQYNGLDQHDPATVLNFIVQNALPKISDILERAGNINDLDKEKLQQLHAFFSDERTRLEESKQYA